MQNVIMSCLMKTNGLPLLNILLQTSTVDGIGKVATWLKVVGWGIITCLVIYGGIQCAIAFVAGNIPKALMILVGIILAVIVFAKLPSLVNEFRQMFE